MTQGERVIQKIDRYGMSVNVVKVDRATGYRFDAHGLESLPLAVELAVKQAQSFREGGQTNARTER